MKRVAAALAMLLGGVAEAATPGPALHVSILRIDDDTRPLLAPGQTLTLSVGVSNLRGDAEARATVLTVTIPAGLKLEKATPPPDRNEPSAAAQKAIWNLNTVAAGAFPEMFELSVTAAADAKAGASLPVNATLTSSDPVGPHSSADFFIVVQPPAADLTVRSNLDSVPVTVGHSVDFSLEAANWGNIPASASALTLTLPPEVKFESADPAPGTQTGNTATWQLGDIAPAAARTIVVKAAADRSLAEIAFDAPQQRLKFKIDGSTSSVQADPPHAHLEIDKLVARAASAIKVWLSVQDAPTPGELPVGKDVTYTVTYGNFGNVPAPHALVSLSLADGLNLVRSEPAAARTSKNDRFKGGVMSWDAGDLAAGQTNIIKSTIHVNSVPDDGALVMASVVAVADGNVAYSLRRGAGHRVVAPHAAGTGSRRLLWLLLLLVSVAVWVALRLRR